ncbi:MAG: 16S rRNA (guanine(527)-N(7))-methyltransferase RsmG [Bacteroidales bacterium]|nr:16S rRNA (guanine(527)-N(7))-methyltransferase RsmG [Bacteroidales bacterium]
MNPEVVFRYFPSLDPSQKEMIMRMKPLYTMWNSRINVISRKDMDNFYLHHVLHSLSLAKIISFIPGTRILDVGTGGGFPGIPLAILFPETQFTLLDSIGKKIRVIEEVVSELGLNNVFPLKKRIEEENDRYDFIVARAVTDFRRFAGLTTRNVAAGGKNTLSNGILYLKGGDLTEELGALVSKTRIWNISDLFPDPFFETKKILYLPS